MRRFLRSMAVLAAVGLTPAVQAADDAPPLRASHDGASCEKKRTDACGCHHHYGLRHCHPKRKTARCEAPARFELPRTFERSEAAPLSL